MNGDLLVWGGLAIALILILYYIVKRKGGLSEVSKSLKGQGYTTPEIVENNSSSGEPPEAISFFTALSKSRAHFSESLSISFAKGFDQDVRDDLESILLSADVGPKTTEWVLDSLVDRSKEQSISDPAGLFILLKQILAETLEVIDDEVEVDETAQKPFVILMIGVNGVGKTTTIGKLAHQFKQEGKKVLLGAGDTFRAAAVEQLKIWGERNEVQVVAQSIGADSASVLFDACESAMARGFDVVLADTAGRLQNKSNLMKELEKIGRVLGKLEIGAPHEVLLVLDAGTGQNAISQVREFAKSIQPTGLIVTKLDGTAKGGIVFALAREFGLPIRYVGLGEGLEDLRQFDRTQFIDALFKGSEG